MNHMEELQGPAAAAAISHDIAQSSKHAGHRHAKWPQNMREHIVVLQYIFTKNTYF